MEIETSKLISRQVRNLSFNRTDLVPKLFFIEQFYGKNSFGFDLYERDMQRARKYWTEKRRRRKIQGRPNEELNKGSSDHFKKIIELFDPDDVCPLTVNRRWLLCDGAHRLALCIYHEIEKVPYRVIGNPALYMNYTIQTYEADFTKKEVEMIQKRSREICPYLDTQNGGGKK